MSRVFIVIAVVFAAVVAPAGAQQGNGAYEPFPEAASETAAGSYLALLGVEASARDLSSGRFLGGLRPAERPQASRRAGVGVPGARWWLVLAVGIGAILVLAAGRHGTRSVAADQAAAARV